MLLLVAFHMYLVFFFLFLLAVCILLIFSSSSLSWETIGWLLHKKLFNWRIQTKMIMPGLSLRFSFLSANKLSRRYLADKQLHTSYPPNRNLTKKILSNSPSRVTRLCVHLYFYLWRNRMLIKLIPNWKFNTCCPRVTLTFRLVTWPTDQTPREAQSSGWVDG